MNFFRLIQRGVAQFGLARLNGVQEVLGSSPSAPTLKNGGGKNMAERQERRKSKRLRIHFVIAYRAHEAGAKYDLSQIKDISKGGLHFTTSRQYSSGAVLSIELRTPISRDRIKLLGKVVASEVLMDGLIYDTRVTYIDMDKDTEVLIEKIIQYLSQIEKKKRF